LNEEARCALEYIQDMAARWRAAERPPVANHDWAWRAQRTLADLASSPSATTVHYGQRYVMPYVDGQYPDSMVQLALVTALRAYGRHCGAALPLERELRAGVGRFFDPKIGTLRRYLRDVGEDKDYDAVDSWYLYHPMMNLARLASDGDAEARDLLLASAEYGIRSARHFAYAWPIFYRIQDFSVITQQVDEGRPGETDTGGIYAYLMLQLHELTGEERFLNEARDALAAADGHGFELMYQVNLTAWGAVACLKLAHLSGDEGFLDRAYYWLSNLFCHCLMTPCDSGAAVHYPTLMAAPCMYNSAYAAPFEDAECFLALGEALRLGGDRLDVSVRTLAEAFRHHALDRGWYYYPDRLPAEIIADCQESGIIDRSLSFPLEDLRLDGTAPGQIGQEIYGAGAALYYAISARS
jgi:hypothetical protein